ncbi:MAG: hypothetical protein PHO37_04815 [Kiritimatiellae bacterium]|nr:hypothetical protein [Kiritimatiellia bacterium]
MNHTHPFMLAASLISVAFISTANGKPQNSPYGVCAHLAGHEFGTHAKALSMMQEGAIAWVRADFPWGSVQPNPDTWRFAHLDTILAAALPHAIQILPILDYNVSFANPAYQHLDQWELYVRKTVERYQDKIPVWEVWNEQNLDGFWKDPEPANYLPLLRRSYETIKSINPDLKVAVGGYAGVPLDYIEKLYALGGGRYFDIMNVHPYSHPHAPEHALEDQLENLKALMKKHGDGDKPIWITEIGWPTPEQISPAPGLIAAALETLLPEKQGGRAIYINDPTLSGRDGPSKEVIARILTKQLSLQLMDIDEVKHALDNNRIDVVIMPISENYHRDGFERIVQYVKEGGIVVILHAMPLWYGYQRTQAGLWEKTNNSAYSRLRIQTEAWWSKKGVIPEELQVKYTGPAEKLSDQPNKIMADRFIAPHGFKEGDRFIPLLQGQAGDYTCTAAAIYDFNSDWKGAVVVSTLRETAGNTVDPQGQARMLPRAQLIARRCGVARIFWYEFQAPEHLPLDLESHFGIVKKDFTPKPAWFAYQNLTAQLPPGSRFVEREWRRGDSSLYYPQWRRPDNTVAGAVWAFKKPGIYRVNFTQRNVIITTHLGRVIKPQQEEQSFLLPLSDSPLFFSGAEVESIDQEPLKIITLPKDAELE